MKTSNGTRAPLDAYYRDENGKISQVSPDEMVAASERVAQAFFNIDGLDSRKLMPYPHDPFHESSLWMKYDHLSVRDRLDQLNLPDVEKAYFECMMNTIGSSPGTEIAFQEPLRWYAMGGHSMAGLFEIIQTYKLGKGGQTRFAKAMYDDFRGHTLLNTEIKQVNTRQNGVDLVTSDGKTLSAKFVICTIPL